ncbi:hypothetical protein GOP47_0025586 [Adiantum capillus-veneris]|uniref:Uncharacterized protein n=1 Tax=Adiantum capillus-veneris TaxID=13818 RepID=A0A9D4U0Z0_ADICA|nr:hypothetical protein GOP47_0025586 [Adiantum capillus-veneris]
MQGPGGQVYPTAPPGMALHRPEDGLTPPANHPFAEPLESPGKAKSPLSKVKHKAKKLKDKIKKVTGSNTTATHGHGDLDDAQKVIQGDREVPPHPPLYEQDDADDSYEEDDNDADRILLGDDRAKFEQGQSIGAMEKPGYGSGVEVHGGVPASALAATPGTYGDKSGTGPFEGVAIPDNAPIVHDDSAEARDDGPISPFKNSGPPGTLQAAPTEYHYTPENDNQMLKGDLQHDSLPEQPKPLSNVVGSENTHVGASSVGMPPAEDVKRFEGLGYTSLDGSSPGSPLSADVSRPAGSRDMLSQTIGPAASESPKFDTDVAYPDDIVKPNPEFGRSSSPTHNKIAVINEDLPAEARLDAGLTPEDYGSQQSLVNKAVPENVPLTFEEDKPYSTLHAVAGSPVKATNDISGRLNNTEQEEPFTEASGARSYGRDEPLVKDDKEEGRKEHAPQPLAADDSVDSGPTSDAFDGSSFIPLADKAATSNAVLTRDPNLNDNEQNSGRLVPVAGILGTDESEKPLATATGEKTSDTREDGENEGLQSTADSNKPVFGQRQSESETTVRDNTPSDDSYFGQNVQTASSDQEGWGKWSADKLNKSKDAVMNRLMASHERAANEATEESAADEVPGKATTFSGKPGSDVPLVEDENARGIEGTIKNDSTPMVGGVGGADADDAIKGLPDHEEIGGVRSNVQPDNVKEDVEYYDPNNANDNQFQEGFALGTGEAEEEVLNGTLAGSTIGKLQGLTDVVATKLGLSSSSHPDTSATESVENANAEDRTEDVSSPPVESDKPPQMGVAQELKNTVVSTLGHGRVTSPRPFNDQHETGTVEDDQVDETAKQPAIPVEEEQEGDTTESQQQSGGALRGLKNVLASKLGYGAHEKPLPNEQTMYDESEEHANAVKAGYNHDDEQQSGGDKPRQMGVAQELKNTVVSTLGHGKVTSPRPFNDQHETGTVEKDQVDETAKQPAIPVEEEQEGDGTESQQQSGGALQGFKNVLASQLGYGTHEKPLPNEQTMYDESEEHANAEKEGYNRDDEQQSGGDKPPQMGVEQQLKNTAVSTLVGHGKVTSPRPFNDQHETGTVEEDQADETAKQPAISVEEEQEGDATESQQQSGGALQGLKNVLASKLGYGAHEKLLPNEQTMYDESEEHANAVKTGYNRDDGVEKVASQQQSGGALQSLRNAVASKLGYAGPTQKPAADNLTEEIADTRNRDQGPVATSPQEVDGRNPPSSYTQRLFNTAADAKGYLSSKVGIGAGKGEDENGSYVEKEKPTSVM